VVAWVGLVLSLALLAVLLGKLDWAQFRRAAAEVPLWAWAGGSAGVLASHVLRALRLRAEWRPRTGATLGECLRLALLHNAAVLLLPFRTGEAGYAWWLHRSWGVPLAEALHSLLWLRLQDLALLGLLAVLLLLPLPLPVSAVVTLALAALLVVALPAALQRLAERFHVPAHGAQDGASPGRGQALARAVAKLLQALAARRNGMASWVFALTNWALRLLVVAGLLVALGVVDLPAGLRGALGGELGALMPLQGPAGLGTYEAGVWAGAAWHAGGAATGAASGAATGATGGRLMSAAAMAELAGAALAVHALWLATGLLAAACAAVLPRLLRLPVRRPQAEPAGAGRSASPGSDGRPP
jgi:hypothetical protein